MFRASNSPDRALGFTIVELLVAMAVLSLLLLLTAQILGHTMQATTASSKKNDAASMARIALDRFGSDFANAILSQGATALYDTPMTGDNPSPAANSSIGFIAKSRARYTSNAAIIADVRGALVGYKIRNLAFPFSGSTRTYVPVLQRGDGRFTFKTDSPADSAASEVGAILSSTTANGTSVERIPRDLVERFPHGSGAESGDENILNWQGMGDGILRFHISFVLSDGTIVQSLKQGTSLDVTYRDFPANTNGALPIAFTPETSRDPSQRFVTGLIVGVVVLDQATLRLAYQQDSNYADTLAGQLERPTANGQTPVGVWQSNLSKATFPPARQNIRFYQRFYNATP
jgi:prepilin-type N-terminal cleavage/methylation domain-containing protein